MESRRAWAKVAAAIDKGDYEETGVEKSKIENAQRELRKKEKTDGTTWDRRYFSAAEEDPIVTKLADIAGESLDDPAKTNGVWIFDEKKYEAVISGKAAAALEATAAKVEQANAQAPASDKPEIPLVEQT